MGNEERLSGLGIADLARLAAEMRRRAAAHRREAQRIRARIRAAETLGLPSGEFAGALREELRAAHAATSAAFRAEARLGGVSATLKAAALKERDRAERQLAAVRKYCGEAAYGEALRAEARRGGRGGDPLPFGAAVGFDTYTAAELNDKPRVVEFPPDTRVKVGRGAEWTGHVEVRLYHGRGGG